MYNIYIYIYIHIYIYILKFASVASAACADSGAYRRNRWALEMAARACSEPRSRRGARNVAARIRSEPHGRSKWPLDPARNRRVARNGCSSPPRSRMAARNWLLEPFSESQRRSKLAARVRSVLEMAARARSASLGRSKTMLRPARLRWSIQIGRSSPPGFAGAFEVLDIAAQAHSDEETCEKTV